MKERYRMERIYRRLGSFLQQVYHKEFKAFYTSFLVFLYFHDNIIKKRK